jgi:Leucine-rich repeat (LRR) protein
LISLDISMNQINDISFLNNKNLSLLRYLKLSNNQLTELKGFQFDKLANLKTLDLSSNFIDNIADCAFHGLQGTLRKLFLNYNQIIRINSCAFSIDFKYLRFVQILYNPMECYDNCQFFFTVYQQPYSIRYEGIECVSNLATVSNQKRQYIRCTFKKYKRIYQQCYQKLLKQECSILKNSHLIKSLDDLNIDNNTLYSQNVQQDYEFDEQYMDPFSQNKNNNNNETKHLIANGKLIFTLILFNLILILSNLINDLNI